MTKRNHRTSSRAVSRPSCPAHRFSDRDDSTLARDGRGDAQRARLPGHGY